MDTTIIQPSTPWRAALLVVVAASACAVPAVRAVLVDAAAALKSE